MANEITQTIQLTATKNAATVSLSTTKRITMSGDDMVQSTQVIGTSAELLVLGDITGAPSQLAIKNLDATNFVEIGGDSGLTVFKIKILPGETVLIRPTSATLYALADTAAVRVQIVAIEA
jgi:hypothetical protein